MVDSAHFRWQLFLNAQWLNARDHCYEEREKGVSASAVNTPVSSDGISARGGQPISPGVKLLTEWGDAPQVCSRSLVINESEFLFQETQLSSVGTRVAILNARLVSMQFVPVLCNVIIWYLSPSSWNKCFTVEEIDTQLSTESSVAILNARLVSINFAANLRFGSCFPALPTNYCARRVGRQKLLKKKLYIYRNYMIEMPIIMRGEPINKYYGTGKKQRCTTSVMPVMGHCDWNIGDKSGHRSLRCKLIFWLEI